MQTAVGQKFEQNLDRPRLNLTERTKSKDPSKKRCGIALVFRLTKHI